MLTTSDKVCLGSALAIVLTGYVMKKSADRNYALINSISNTMKTSQGNLYQIYTEAVGANIALKEGNNMMRTILTNKVNQI